MTFTNKTGKSYQYEKELQLHKLSYPMFFLFQRFNNKNLNKIFTLVGIVYTKLP